jgi:hypothetical protein
MVRERRRYATYGTILAYFHFYRQSATKEERKVSDRRTWDLGISDLSVSPLIDHYPCRRYRVTSDVHGCMLTCPTYTGHQINSVTYMPGVGLGGLPFNSDSDPLDD